MNDGRCTLQKGRPREFDCDVVLDRALEVFWRKGYEGASMSELTEAMGINRPSLYAAFGNKEELFRKALDRYANGPAAYAREALAARTAREVAERLLHGAAHALTDPNHPPGCLGVQGALSCGEAADTIREELSSRRSSFEMALRQRFERAQAEGDLKPKINCADLARLITTVTQGMAVQAASGVTRKELLKVVSMVLLAWPS
jgi:AcrR family transcriptional regulator